MIIQIAPPELPVYEQPAIPAYGYIWAPGYWAYGPDGYFWVPGTWVQPPSVGLLWTPGYWGWHDGIYGWNAGYWGPHIGFYGGVNYGFGYGGVGYEGGRGTMACLPTIGPSIISAACQSRMSTIRPLSTTPSVTRVSFNGGAGGTTAQPTPQEQAAASEPHVAATPMQTQHEQTASTNKTLLASVNHGNPAIAATSKPGEFTGKGVVPAKRCSRAPLPPKACASPRGHRIKRSRLSTPALQKMPGPQANDNQARPLAAVTPPKAAIP